jgi:Tfp pilus assembly protein PilF
MNDRREPPERLPLQELVGTTLGDYVIRRIVGHGSMGVVFEAHHAGLDRRVAIKALPPGLGATEKAIQRFLREAQAVAQLTHESIVPIYEIRQTGAIHWYTMRFLEGEPLDRLVKNGPLEQRHAAKLIQAAARAIHFAHHHGIIHRDVKPANMILDGEGRLVITDFGLARPEQGAGITDSGAMVGTPLYMSPEQIRARKGEVDRRTDIWSLGATLFELLTATPPFHGESTQEILQAILDGEPRSPRALRPDLHADLEVIVLKALEKEPKRRYASALELAQDLERFLEGEPITARRTTALAKGLRVLRRHKAIVALAAAIVLIVAGFSWLTKRSNDRQREKAYQSAVGQGRTAFAEGNFLVAGRRYDEALREVTDDVAAHLGRARAWCSLGQLWESQQKDGKQKPDLEAEFGSVDRLYGRAFADLTFVLERTPADPVAAFYRGFLRRSWKEALDPDAGFDDLQRAEQLGATDWETQFEFSKFRLAMAKGMAERPSHRSELIEQALRNAGEAVKLLAERVGREPSAYLQTWQVRLFKFRGELYREMWETGHLVDYLQLAIDDYDAALLIDDRDVNLGVLRQKSADDLAQATRPAPPVPNAGARPDGRPAAELVGDFLSLFNPRQPDEQGRALASILARGGELIAPLIAGAGNLGEGVMDRFVNPYFEGAVVTDAARSDAERSADRGRAILQAALARNEPPTRSEREQARDLLRAAVAGNPRNAQFSFELAIIEQALGELAEARKHLETAAAIAPGNPIFRLQLALACEQQDDLSAAATHAAAASALAPGSTKLRETAERLSRAASAAAPTRSDEARDG